MAYDQNEDKILLSIKKEYNDGSALIASVMQYKNGPKKLNMTRTYLERNEVKFGKLGRLNIEECKWIQENIESIVKKMES